ncbi:MAG: C-GCAxxG-C-C family protein [Bacteroidota bacterium]
MDRSEKAAEIFSGNFNCAQAVFSSMSGELGIDDELAKKISCGFGAGMAYTGQTCGAVTGAFMLIGLKYGMSDQTDTQSKEKTYRVIQEFRDRFSEMHGGITCRELLGYDFSTPEGMEMIKKTGINKQRCPGIVKDAARLASELLDLK